MEKDLNNKRIKEAVCIDTARVYDSCADRDCIPDTRVYFTDCAQAVIDNANSVRCRSCEVLNVFSEVEKVPFNRGFYSVDLTFFFSVSFDAFVSPNCQPETVTGLSVFNKKCILYGSEGNVKVFSSEFKDNAVDEQFPMTSTNPRAKIQVAEPICLDAKLCRPCDCCSSYDTASVPLCIGKRFSGRFDAQSEEKAVRVTLGLFSIVQLERDVQMLVPAYDFCMPEKECSFDTEDPCDSFRRIKFPVDEFFPAGENDEVDAYSDYPGGSCSCGCDK